MNDRNAALCCDTNNTRFGFKQIPLSEKLIYVCVSYFNYDYYIAQTHTYNDRHKTSISAQYYDFYLLCETNNPILVLWYEREEKIWQQKNYIYDNINIVTQVALMI